jgi:hypothetical protein
MRERAVQLRAQAETVHDDQEAFRLRIAADQLSVFADELKNGVAIERGGTAQEED